MCSAKAVEKNIRLGVKGGQRIMAGSVEELKDRVAARGMRTPHFRQLLAGLKHQSVIRGFRLTQEPYIQG